METLEVGGIANSYPSIKKLSIIQLALKIEVVYVIMHEDHLVLP